MAAKKQLKRAAPKAKKVNKDAVPTEIEPLVVSDEEYRCSCCGHKYKKQEGNFNRSKSPIYKGNNGFMSICKRCVAELYEQYVKFFDGDEDAAAERICQITDMYFDSEVWAMSRKISESRDGKSRNRISTYVSKLNLRQVDGSGTYADTLVKRWEQEQAEEEPDTVSEDNSEEKNISKESLRRFGVGFKPEEYDTMEGEYASWVEKEGEPIDKRQEELYIMMCYAKLALQRSVQNDMNGIGTITNSYRSTIEAATTEIEDRKKKAKAEMELKPLGVLIRDIEDYCPAEYYRDKKLYTDFDHLKEYIMRFMTRPLRNLLTDSKETDKEFSLSGSEE